MLAFYFMAQLNKFILVDSIVGKDFISNFQVQGRNSAHEPFFLPTSVDWIELSPEGKDFSMIHYKDL